MKRGFTFRAKSFSPEVGSAAEETVKKTMKEVKNERREFKMEAVAGIRSKESEFFLYLRRSERKKWDNLSIGDEMASPFFPLDSLPLGKVRDDFALRRAFGRWWRLHDSES